MGQLISRELSHESFAKIIIKSGVEPQKIAEYSLKGWHTEFMEKYGESGMTREQLRRLLYERYPCSKFRFFIDDAFRVFDTNRDGRIDFEELSVGIIQLESDSAEDRYPLIFRFIDRGNTGYISKADMVNAVRNVREMIEGNCKSRREAYERQGEKIFRKMDRDRKGKVDLDHMTRALNNDTRLRTMMDMKEWSK